MPDFIDRSVEQQGMMLDASIKHARQANSNKLKPKGRCHFCDEPVDGTQIFCDIDCSVDHERLTRQRNLRSIG